MSEGTKNTADEGRNGEPTGVDDLETRRIYRLLGAATVGVWTGHDLLGLFRGDGNELVLSHAALGDDMIIATALRPLEAWVPADTPLACVVLDPVSGGVVVNADLVAVLFRHHPGAGDAFRLLGRTLLGAMAELPETTEAEAAFLRSEMARQDTDTARHLVPALSGVDAADAAALEGSPTIADWEEARREAVRRKRWVTSVPSEFPLSGGCMDPGCSRRVTQMIHLGPATDPEMVTVVFTCRSHARAAVRQNWDFISQCPCRGCRQARGKFAPRGRPPDPPPDEARDADDT